MHTLVIARYQEDLSWIAEIPDDFRVVIYNKGEPLVDPVACGRADSIINRPNAGRESETYLHHMLTHRLADGNFTVFTQGDPFEHSPDFIALLHHWRDWADVQPLTCQWKGREEVPPRLVSDTYQASHPGQLRVRPERFSLYTWGPLEFNDVGALRTALDYRQLHGDLPEGTQIAADFLDRCALFDLAAEAADHALGVFCYGAIFAVRNHLQLRLDNDNLERMIALSKGLACYGYVLERLWLHFFGVRFETPRFPTVMLQPANFPPIAA